MIGKLASKSKLTKRSDGTLYSVCQSEQNEPNKAAMHSVYML